MAIKDFRSKLTLNWLLEELDLPEATIEITFIAISALLLIAKGETQQIVFILFGAPVIYAALKRGFQHGVIIAVFAGLVVTLGRHNDLLRDWHNELWLHLFFNGFFVPLFYLAFCLLIAWVILNEREMKQEYQNLSSELQQAYNDNLNLFTSTISALAATIEAKDPYTKGHSERVQEIVRCMLGSMKLAEHEKRNIIYAAILHDIGKIGIRGDILSKKTGLTTEEFEEIKKHPEIGANILHSIEQFGEVLPIIYYHHERYDGKGYPDGLKGREIPFGARILAIADTYDAITSNRPYRLARSQQWAREEMRRCAGTQFDAQLLEIFFDCMERIEQRVSSVG